MLATEVAFVADLYARSISGLLHAILKPEQIRTDDEYRGYFAGVVSRTRSVGSSSGWPPVGVLAMAEEWIEQLYVDPPEQRRGVGSALLAHGKALSPDCLRVLTLQRNTVAADSTSATVRGLRHGPKPATGKRARRQLPVAPAPDEQRVHAAPLTYRF